MSELQLIVGLGNPGPEYKDTRHNAGSWFVENLSRIYQAPLKVESKFHGLTARATIAGKDIRLLVPSTFMNRSGKAVAALAKFYRIPVDSILVAFDELDLPPGTAKFKTGGSSTQNGIKDIVACMGNDKGFHRLRIGIGHPGDRQKVTGYVLGKAPKADQEKMDLAIDEAIRCTEILIKNDMTMAMNRLHSFRAE